jgi:prevent-host-death family protein
MESATTWRVSIHEAKTHLSRLIAAAEAGEDVVISRGKNPAVRLVPVTPKPRRRPGVLAHLPAPPDEAFAPLSDEELKEWFGDVF